MDAAASAGVGATAPEGHTLPSGKGLLFGVLGPLVAFRDGAPVVLGGPKEQLVLAYLLAHANAPVSTDALVEALWGDAPPRSAERTLQAYVSRLRRAVGPSRSTGDRSTVLSRSGGYYRLVVPPDSLDSQRFEELARLGAAQVAGGEPAAVDTLTEALGLWRGDAYGDFADVESCEREARRLDELRLCAVEDRVDAELAAGGAAVLVAQLETAVVEQPFRERRWGQLMLALYRAGRQRDALATYQRARRLLIEELGVEPGSALRHLEAAMLDQDPGLDRVGLLESSPHGALPAALGSVGPAFVGRADELAWLREAWNNALGGRGGFVSVLGPEGMGKTRLLAELAREVQREGAIVLYGRCDHAHRGPTALLDQTLRSGGASLAAVDVPVDDLAAATLRYVTSWSASHPVLIVLDDLHLADADTLEVVADLAGWSTASRTLIVAAFRSELPDADLDQRDGVGMAQITLAGLDHEALRDLCELYGPDLWSAGDLARLQDLTAGVPLLVHEHAGAWAKERVADRVEEAAARSTAARARLATSRRDVALGVEGIQRLAELQRANLAGREAELRAGQGLEPCPYKGLATFEAADAANFFGRERLVAELVARLAEARMLAVVGPSGSGKSSLVRAGLVPALVAGALPVEGAGGRWCARRASRRRGACASPWNAWMHRRAGDDWSSSTSSRRRSRCAATPRSAPPSPKRSPRSPIGPTPWWCSPCARTSSGGAPSWQISPI
jgi:DNA-binding SARP family transcriptional activator/energy-coupling factor transporter ATP-binding protein EcfA2